MPKPTRNGSTGSRVTSPMRSGVNDLCMGVGWMTGFLCAVVRVVLSDAGFGLEYMDMSVNLVVGGLIGFGIAFSSIEERGSGTGMGRRH
jgi:hypothetical protein